MHGPRPRPAPLATCPPRCPHSAPRTRQRRWWRHRSGGAPLELALCRPSTTAAEPPPLPLSLQPTAEPPLLLPPLRSSLLPHGRGPDHAAIGPRQARPSPSASPSHGSHCRPCPAVPPRRMCPQLSALPGVRAPTCRPSPPRACCAATTMLSSPGLVQPRPLSFSRRLCRQHPLPSPAQAPARLDPPRRPPLHRLRWIRCCRGLPGRIHLAADFSARSAVPLAGSRLPSRSVAVVAFPAGSDVPLLLCRGHGHHDRRRRVRCRRPPWQGSLMSLRSKKQECRPVGALLSCRPADS